MAMATASKRDDTISAMAEINIIREAGELTDFLAAAGRSGWVSMDTEFLRERTYFPKLCLIQITDGERTACIDPLAVDDLAPLGELLANPRLSKIFHSCRQDLEAMDTRVAVRANNLYDTQLAAAFCGYGEQVSYAALVESVCAVHLPKSHTRADWSRRPLPREQLDYAVDDVAYLHPLRCELDRRLEQKGRVEWHRDECAAAVDPANYHVDPNTAWRRLKGVDRLDAAGQACAAKLALWRERRAHDRDLPRGWILPTPVLLQICRKRPKTFEGLANINDISPGVVKRAGTQILAMVEDSGNGNGNAPTPMLTILNAAQKRRAKKIMGWLERRSEQEEISRALLANRQEVEDFVRGQTDLPLFKGWRLQLAGADILARY